MGKIDFERIMQRVAEREGTTPGEIHREITELIGHCWQDAQVRKAWALIRPDGEKPTAEELIAYVSDEVRREIEEAEVP